MFKKIGFTIAILIIATFFALTTGCTNLNDAANNSIVRKMAEIERIKQDCKKCEKNLPGQCLADVFSCQEILK